MSRLSTIATLLTTSIAGIVMLAPASSRGDVDPAYKCVTYDPMRAFNVTGFDGRVYCCSASEPRPLPPANITECSLAPWDHRSEGSSSCIDRVVGNVTDTADGDLMAEDADPLEFYLTPSPTCDLCAGTTEASLLDTARVQAAEFCRTGAKFSGGPSKLLSFEPAGTGRSACSPWKFRCSCPPRGALSGAPSNAGTQ